jgi:UDP-N-acetylmuramoylalanine--D-glutamate ligase
LELHNKRVLVVGLAKTGLAVAGLLKRKGSDVIIADTKTEEQLGTFGETAKAMGIPLCLGTHRTEDFSSRDLVVISPGVPHTIEPLQAARRAGVPVIGEIELAARLIDEPIVAITGTNGKTTTTHLTGEMLQASGLRVFVGGNIGRPLVDYVSEGIQADVIVAEISSFQLDTIETFRPRVAVLLNITEDHLDRYDDFLAYVQSKGRLFVNQEATDFAVLNCSDRYVGMAASKIRSRRLCFNAQRETEPGAWIEGRHMVCRLSAEKPQVLDLTQFALKGSHNLENAAAGALAAFAAGGTREGIQRALDTFKGLQHRIEHIRTVRGVHYYNDSKGTNVDAVFRALESFAAPVVLIMGGRDKGGGYGVLEERVKKGVKRLVVLGEAREKILNALGGATETREAVSLEDAVRLAGEAAEPGDVVLLSPGCSSFDMFSDYAQRGRVFCDAVRRL